MRSASCNILQTVDVLRPEKVVVSAAQFRLGVGV